MLGETVPDRKRVRRWTDLEGSQKHGWFVDQGL